MGLKYKPLIKGRTRSLTISYRFDGQYYEGTVTRSKYNALCKFLDVKILKN